MLPIPFAASVTLAPLIGLPFASRAVTVMVEEPVPTVIDVGDATTVDCEADTAPASRIGRAAMRLCRGVSRFAPRLARTRRQVLYPSNINAVFEKAA